jgi:hypothetical protein
MQKRSQRLWHGAALHPMGQVLGKIDGEKFAGERIKLFFFFHHTTGWTSILFGLFKDRQR